MYRLLLNTGGGDGNGDPAPTNTDGGLARLQKKHGDALAGLLYSNVQHLQGQVADLRSKTPKEGAVVLEGDDAATWNEFRSLNLKPADIRTGLSERDTLKAETARHTRDKALASAGFKPETLAPLLPVDAVIEVRDGEKGRDGKPTKVATIKAGDGNPTPLNDWIGSNLSHFPAGTFGGVEASQGGPPPVHKGSPPAPTVRKDGPPPVQGQGGGREDYNAIATDLRVQVGYGGF